MVRGVVKHLAILGQDGFVAGHCMLEGQHRLEDRNQALLGAAGVGVAHGGKVGPSGDVGRASKLRDLFWTLATAQVDDGIHQCVVAVLCAEPKRCAGQLGRQGGPTRVGDREGARLAWDALGQLGRWVHCVGAKALSQGVQVVDTSVPQGVVVVGIGEKQLEAVAIEHCGGVGEGAAREVQERAVLAKRQRRHGQVAGPQPVSNEQHRPTNATGERRPSRGEHLGCDAGQFSSHSTSPWP